MPATTLTVHFQERFGATDRILSVLRRRGFPLEGITLERTHRQDVGRMTVAVTDRAAVQQVAAHLDRLPDVMQVEWEGADDAVKREYALVRVGRTPETEGPIGEILSRHGARAVTTTRTHLVVEASGSPSEMDDLFAALAPFGIDESARTYPMALHPMPAPAEGS